MQFPFQSPILLRQEKSGQEKHGMPTAICGVDATPGHQIRRLCLPGVDGKNGTRVAIKFSGQINEVNEKN